MTHYRARICKDPLGEPFEAIFSHRPDRAFSLSCVNLIMFDEDEVVVETIDRGNITLNAADAATLLEGLAKAYRAQAAEKVVA